MGRTETSRVIRYVLLVDVLVVAAGAATYVVTRPAQTPARDAAAPRTPVDAPPVERQQPDPSPQRAESSPQQPDPSPQRAESSPPEPAPSKPLSQDERYRQLVVGTWEDDYEGKRTMTLKPDGTGIMIVELSGMKAKLFAARLEFDMVWSLEDGRLKKRTTGGRPEARVNMILKMMGDQVDEPILELSEERLLLLDKDGTTQYDWRRTKS